MIVSSTFSKSSLYDLYCCILTIFFCVCTCSVTQLCPTLFVTMWTVPRQAPPSMGFPRQEYWNELLFPSSRDLPDTGIKPTSPAFAGEFLITEPPGKPHYYYRLVNCNVECFGHLSKICKLQS